MSSAADMPAGCDAASGTAAVAGNELRTDGLQDFADLADGAAPRRHWEAGHARARGMRRPDG
jgi:hypothetical protein